jgi:hypothetical protein
MTCGRPKSLPTHTGGRAFFEHGGLGNGRPTGSVGNDAFGPKRDRRSLLRGAKPPTRDRDGGRKTAGSSG